ncbi:hypothetical protein O1R50_00790 [Glycomyces luteolus]|uniref:Uncharacterized protein n=1 Tax=Glycomyces luteolus TaxID=2670330 RepID=A0A9X3P6K5_9ACTN|nr:hypothetical protein [Glycomyces luteolus]MDA1358142.1 hypothetical protein [Glycomyces luteolus]
MAKYIGLAPVLGPASGRYSRNRKLWEAHRAEARMDEKSFFRFTTKEQVRQFLQHKPATLEDLLVAIMMGALGLCIPYLIAGVPAVFAALQLFAGEGSVTGLVVFSVSAPFVIWTLIAVLRYQGRFHWVRRGMLTDDPTTGVERFRLWLVTPNPLDWVWVPICVGAGLMIV